MSNVGQLFARAAAARNGLGGLGYSPGEATGIVANSTGSNCPAGTAPGVKGPSGNRYCVGMSAAPTMVFEEMTITGRPSASTRTEMASNSILDIFGGGTSAGGGSDSPAESGGGFFSSFTDALSSIPQKALDSIFGKANAAGPGYNLNVPQPSSPLPWVIGGVAVAGLLAVVLLRSKK